MKLDDPINCMTAVIFEAREIETGNIYRMIHLVDEMPQFELYSAEIGIEELGDAESGPMGFADYVTGWNLISEGMGHPPIEGVLTQYYSDEPSLNDKPSRGIGGQQI